MYESHEYMRLAAASLMAAIAGDGAEDEMRRRPPTARDVQDILGPQRNAFAGETYYLAAEAYYYEALEAVPAHAIASRHLATLLGARSRWAELREVAHARIAGAPWDAAAWMWLGLAAHRLGDVRTSMAAFDSGLTRMAVADRVRLDRLERILRPADSVQRAQLPADERAALELMYWLYSDPLWSVEGQKPRGEFLARITHAELRWSMPEFNVLGAESDRGKTHVRWGPADVMVTRPVPNGQPLTNWTYLHSGLSFSFRGYNLIVWAEPDYVDRAIEAAPVRWDNIATIRVDSMPARAVRFRAGDSVAVALVAAPSVQSIALTTDVRGSVQAHAWLMRGGTTVATRDSIPARPDSAVMFTHTVAPGYYVYRAEASAIGALRAARHTSVLAAREDTTTGFALSGFGMSDVMFATTATPRASSVLRWHDLSITPLAESVVTRSPLVLVWENYDLAASDGAARYTVAISLERVRSRAGEIVAGIAGAVGIDRTRDRVTMRVNRSVPSAPVVLDQLEIDLAGTPAGTYRLVVEVTDEVTGRKTARSMPLALVN
jgi:hypothetical protein